MQCKTEPAGLKIRWIMDEDPLALEPYDPLTYLTHISASLVEAIPGADGAVWVPADM